MATPFNEMSAEEQQAHLAKQGKRVQQNTDFISSEIQLEVGLKLISKQQFENWFTANRESLRLAATNAIYETTRSKETKATKREMEAKGIQFVDYEKVDWSNAPQDWEIESFKSNPAMGGKTLVVICQPRDEYSFNRQHVLLQDLSENFTTQTIQQLLDYHFENAKSVWGAKSKSVRENDIDKKKSDIVAQASADLGPAAKVVASFEAMTNVEKATALQDTAYRDRFMAASNLLKAAKSFK